MKQEVSRFSDPTDWLMMTWISGVHLVLPLIICLLCSITLYRANKDWWKIIGTCLPFAKIRAYLLEKKLFKAMAKSEPEVSCIKNFKETLDEHEDSLTLALLIESSCESSFQFFTGRATLAGFKCC